MGGRYIYAIRRTMSCNKSWAGRPPILYSINIMREKKLPVAGAKRFGHRSTASGFRMMRTLDKSGYFDKSIKKLHKMLEPKKGGDTRAKSKDYSKI